MHLKDNTFIRNLLHVLEGSSSVIYCEIIDVVLQRKVLTKDDGNLLYENNEC